MSVIKEDSIYGVKFYSNIIEPKGAKNVRTFIALKTPRYIVWHNTANTAKTADDRMHGKYLQNLENADKEYKSWHFTVDEDSITQHIPYNERCYHAGDGAGKGNANGIAIEICENGDYAKAEENAMKLTIYLQEKEKIPDSNVKAHFHFSGKICPRRIIKSKATAPKDWEGVIGRLSALRFRLTKNTSSPIKAPVTAPKSSEKAVKKGSVVTVKSSVKKWVTGQTISSWVYKDKFEVIGLSGNTVTLSKVGSKGAVTGKLKIADVTAL